MIEVFKIIKHKYDYKVVPELIYSSNNVARGEMIYDCVKEVIMILENFHLIIELFLFWTVCQML